MGSDFIDLIAEPATQPTPAEYERAFRHARTVLADRPAWVDEFNRSHNWTQLLEAGGWTLAYTDRDGVEHWVRPGKERREGTSATVNYGGSDLLYVWTTSIPWLRSNRAYDKYGFVAHRDHGGDFKAAARALGQVRATTTGWDLFDEPPKVDPETGEVEDNRSRIEQAEMPLSSEAFWNADEDDEDFLIAPFLIPGRAHALYAEAKVGKSYVVLQAVAAASIPGHTSWADVPKEPITVLYLDYEMTESDLRERLEIFGYGPKDDYSRFHYIKASMLGADLDTMEGGLDLLHQAQRWGCDLVVVDTMSRAVSGDENDANTVQDFYRHTGRVLKANGIAWLRIDHAGKAKERGQRGSSGKNDDVDVVWRLDRTDNGAALHLTHSRVFWLDQMVSLANKETDEGIVHVRSLVEGVPAGVAEKARIWLELGIPLDASRRKAQAAGLACKANLFSHVKRYVNEQAERNALRGLI